MALTTPLPPSAIPTAMCSRSKRSQGKVIYVSPDSGETIKLATVAPPLDNIAIAPDDTIYVSRPTDNTIIAIDHESGKQTPLVQGAFSAPGGLAVTERNGRPALIVADPFGYRFTDPVTGTTETLPFDMAARSATSVAVNDKLIVTSNVRNSNVVVIDKASGRVLHTVKGFKDPMGVAVTNTGEIYVAEYASGEILKILPDAMPDRMPIAVDLQGPVGLALDKVGRLVVSEATRGTITRIDPATSQKEVIARDLAQPEGLAILPTDNIVVAEVAKKQLTHIDSTGSHVIAADLPFDTFMMRAPAPVYLPTGVATDTQGAIYVTVGCEQQPFEIHSTSELINTCCVVMP